MEIDDGEWEDSDNSCTCLVIPPTSSTLAYLRTDSKHTKGWGNIETRGDSHMAVVNVVSTGVDAKIVNVKDGQIPGKAEHESLFVGLDKTSISASFVRNANSIRTRRATANPEMQIFKQIHIYKCRQ